jgi:hypothetical protein
MIAKTNSFFGSVVFMAGFTGGTIGDILTGVFGNFLAITMFVATFTLLAGGVHFATTLLLHRAVPMIDVAAIFVGNTSAFLLAGFFCITELVFSTSVIGFTQAVAFAGRYYLAFKKIRIAAVGGDATANDYLAISIYIAKFSRRTGSFLTQTDIIRAAEKIIWTTCVVLTGASGIVVGSATGKDCQ